jgi:hypothetical protein
MSGLLSQERLRRKVRYKSEKIAEAADMKSALSSEELRSDVQNLDLCWTARVYDQRM